MQRSGNCADDDRVFQHWIRSWLTFIGASTSHPLAFVVVTVYVAMWLVFYDGPLGWQSTATVATWIMTLFISALNTATPERYTTKT